MENSWAETPIHQTDFYNPANILTDIVMRVGLKRSRGSVTSCVGECGKYIPEMYSCESPYNPQVMGGGCRNLGYSYAWLGHLFCCYAMIKNTVWNNIIVYLVASTQKLLLE